MAPRIVGELAGGMARSGHIRHENYGFSSVKRPVPTPVFSHSPELHLGNMGPTAYGGTLSELPTGAAS